MKNIKNVFLDRDGIINQVIMRGSLVSSPRSLDEFSIRSEFTEFYKLLNQSGDYNIFVISNQPDVARGLLKDQDLIDMTRSLEEQFKFLEVVYCRHDDSHKCQCRKPKPGMILTLMEKYELKPAESVVIGDSDKDILAAEAAGVNNILLLTSYNQARKAKARFTVKSLKEIFLLDLGIVGDR